MKKNPGKCSRFTLIEIMVVLTVVLILASIGIMVGPMVARHSSEAKTKALMSMLDNALQEYKNSDISGGHFPVSEDMVDSVKGTQYTPLFLFGDENMDAKNVKGTILQFFEPEQIKSHLRHIPGKGHCIQDAFGMPFLYMSPGYRMNGGYDLVSMGADNMPGDNDAKKMKKTNSSIYNRLMNGNLSVEDKKESPYAVQLGEGDDLANFKSK